MLFSNNNYICIDLCCEGDFLVDYMSFLTNQPTELEVVCFEKCRLFRISRKNFTEILSLGIGLFAFLLIPNTIQGWENNKIKSVLLVVSISIFFFLSFYIDSLFQDIELAATMGFIGLLLGLGYLFLRNFWIVYLSLFIIMLVNTLADNKYDEYSFWIVIISTLLSITILMFGFIKNKNTSKE